MCNASQVAKSLTWLCTLAIVVGGTATDGAELFFNSYGWSSIYRYDLGTGMTTHIPAADILDTTFCSSAAFGPDGALYGVGSDEVVRITFSGGMSYWSPYLKLDHFAFDGLAFNPQGQLYTASGHTIRRVNASGQTVAAITPTYQGKELFLSGIGFGPDGSLWAADAERIFSVNAATGLATLRAEAEFSTGGTITALSVGADGVVRGLGYFDRIFTYDPETGSHGWSDEPLKYNGQPFAPSSLAVLANLTPPIASSDFDGDGDVDGADLLAWQRGLGGENSGQASGDANHDGKVDEADLAVWRIQRSASATTAVPEPASVIAWLFFAGAINVRRQGRRVG